MTGQMRVIRNRAQPEKLSNRPHFTHQPPFHPFLPISFLLPPALLFSAHGLISWHSPTEPLPMFWTLRFASLATAKSWFVLQFFVTPSVSVTERLVSGCGLCWWELIMFYNFVSFLPFPYLPNWEKKIFTFHISFIIIVSEQGCSYQDLPYHMFVCVWSCSCLPWSDTIKRADILLPHTFTGFFPSLMDEENICRRWFCSSSRGSETHCWLLGMCVSFHYL